MMNGNTQDTTNNYVFTNEIYTNVLMMKVKII